MNLFRVMLLSMSLLVLGACDTIDESDRGVWVYLGEAESVATPGFHIYNPLTYDLVKLDVLEQKSVGETSTYTKDVQKAQIKYALTFRLDATKVKETYKTAGINWKEKLLSQAIERSIKDVIGTKAAVAEVINKRSAVQDKIEDVLRARLAKNRILLSSFELTDVSFSDSFEKAVEAKQVAVEIANAEKNKTVAVQERANQEVITATAAAEAIKIKAQALSSNPKYAELEWIAAWKETGGKVPQTVVTGGKGIPFIPTQPSQ